MKSSSGLSAGQVMEMRFNKILQKSSPEHGFYRLSAVGKWCCNELSSYTLRSMITNSGLVVYYIELDDRQPWLKLKSARYWPFCGEGFDLVENSIDLRAL